jgi:hypothetical protein
MSGVVLAVMFVATTGATQKHTSLTGTWTFTIKSGETIGTPTVKFNQRDETLTGHYSSAMYGEADLKGTVKRQSITFTVFAKYQGQPQDLVFTGEYDGSRLIKGTYSTSFGNGAFTAVRK